MNVTGYSLHPCRVSEIMSTKVPAIENFCGGDLPYKMALAAEVEMRKEKCVEYLADEQLEKMTLVGALKFADKKFFPNIHEVSKLILLVLFHVNVHFQACNI